MGKRTNPTRARVDLAELNPLLRTNPDEFSRTRAKCLCDFGYSDEVSAECCDRVASYLPSMPRLLCLQITIGDQAGYCRRLASEHYRGFLGCHDITAAWLNLIEKCLQVVRKNYEVAD